MSYSIVKSIILNKNEKKVFVRASDNNVYPKNFDKFEADLLTKIYKEKGEKEVIKVILLEYWRANFQKSDNAYQHSVDLFDRTKYNWDYTSEYSNPEMTEEDRLYITNSIKHVDKAFLSLDEDASICKSLEHIKPDIFAKGGDRHEGNIPELEICQKVGIKIESGFGAKIRSSSDLIKNKPS